jgi:cytochrome c biogenesis protein CcdA
MTVILSLYYLAHSKSAKNMFWFLLGLFLIHFTISGVIIWGLKEEIDAIKDNIKIINSYVLIFIGSILILYSLIPKKPKSNQVTNHPHYYGTLPFFMGIIAPFIDFPALVEYVFLSIQINLLFDKTIYRVIANIGLNIVFHIPIILFWLVAISDNQEIINTMKDKLHQLGERIDSKQPYVSLGIGAFLIIIGIFLQY